MKLLPEYEAGSLTDAGTPVPNWWPIRRRLEIAHEWARSPALDVGGGTGWLSLHLRQWGIDVTASDFSDDALATFRANVELVGMQIPISQQDVTNLTYEDDRFASVFCISVLPYVPNLDLALRELKRVLAPGGIAVMDCYNAYGTYALINDRDPRTLFRKLRDRGGRYPHPHNFHAPRWWKATFAQHFDVLEVMPVEALSPVIARFRGYDAPEAWTRADIRLAAHVPKALASDVVYILRKTDD
jgi:SAM-dependent methyltransferase